jgi:hypothetical protein
MSVWTHVGFQQNNFIIQSALLIIEYLTVRTSGGSYTYIHPFGLPKYGTFGMLYFNPLALSDPYMGRTAQLTSRRCILNTYLTNICTEYF